MNEKLKELYSKINWLHTCIALMLLLSLAGAHNAVMCIGLFYIMNRVSQ
jgi:hypothetical protein